MGSRVTWQLVGHDEEKVLNEASMLPPGDGTNPVWIVSVESVNSGDGKGDVFIKYRDGMA